MFALLLRSDVKEFVELGDKLVRLPPRHGLVESEIGPARLFCSFTDANQRRETRARVS